MKLFKDTKFIFLLFAVFLVITLEIFSLINISIPMPYAPYIFSVFILGIGYKVIWNGMKALLRFKFSSINLLMLLAVLGAFYLGEYPEGAVVIVLYVLGERLEDIGIEKSKASLNELVKNSPKTAIIKGLLQPVEIEKIPIGSILQIKAGEMIPLDGKIIVGETSVDEASITGESIPKDKCIGDLLFAGTINKNGYIEMETTKLSIDTTFAKIIRLTFEAKTNKSDTQKFIQKFSQIYTPSIIILALLLFIVPVLFFRLDFNHWLQQSISLLVIACPCALVISTPVAIYSAIGNASSKGALIKGGKYIEELARIKAIALDKTRTITFGSPIVSDIFPINGIRREELLACASGVEMFSEHPLAQAIVDEVLKEGIKPHNAEDFISVIGKGATAKCQVCKGKIVTIGKLSYIKEFQTISEEVEKIVEKLSSEGKTSVVICFDDMIAGIIGLSDKIKPDTLNAVKEIKSLDITPLILTGDNEKTGMYVARQVGISEVFGNLLPEQKANKIDELIDRFQYVAMVGDGINDTPALAKSNVGIAMGAFGSDAAIETANIALMNDNLSLIPFLVRLSKTTLKRIKLNTIGAISIKILFVVLALLGYSNLFLAIFADTGVTIIVILLSLQLIKFK
jgi:Cd2+/Zn2+-exporting ATPase